VSVFKREREAVIEATEAARDGISLALVVASVAVALAAVAIAISVSRSD
jgi:hypothetical protein